MESGIQLCNMSWSKPRGVESLTPTEWTMHLGVPVVPDENMMNKGWLKGTCSNFNEEPSNPLMKSSNRTL